MSDMPHVLRIRDVVHDRNYDMGPEVRVLRVPYDMFHPKGAVREYGPELEWAEGQELRLRRGRFAEAVLGQCRAGERVLVRLPLESTDRDDWWLCDVIAVDHVSGD